MTFLADGFVVLETDGSFTAVAGLPAGPSAATESLGALPRDEENGP